MRAPWQQTPTAPELSDRSVPLHRVPVRTDLGSRFLLSGGTVVLARLDAAAPRWRMHVGRSGEGGRTVELTQADRDWLVDALDAPVVRCAGCESRDAKAVWLREEAARLSGLLNAANRRVDALEVALASAEASAALPPQYGRPGG